MSVSSDRDVSEPISPSVSEIGQLSQRAGRLLRLFGAARRSRAMTADDVLLFVALGHLGQLAISSGVSVRPVTCQDLSALLAIPKETVRRKLARLVELGLAESTTRGALIKDHDEWRRLAARLLGGAEADVGNELRDKRTI